MMHRIDLMGPEYVLMLGAWWGVFVILTVLAMVTRRALARHGRPRVGNTTPEAAGGHSEP